MQPYGLYSLANTPEELLSTGYGQDLLYDYDPAFGKLRTVQRYQPAPFTGARPFQTMYDIAPYTPNGTDLGFNADLYDPSFGGISGYRDVGGNQNQDTNIMQQAPLNMNRFQGVSDMSIIDETTDDEQDQDYIDQVEKSRNSLSGIMDLLRNIPTPFNLARRGLESLRGVNQRLRNTDFGQSSTLQEYFERKRQRDQAKRAQEAMPDVYASAKEQSFTNDRGGFSTTSADKAGTSLGSGQFSPSTSRGRSGY